MAEKQMMSIIATTSERISDLVIKNGQLIFIHDMGRIALDYNGKRTFYNQIVERNNPYFLYNRFSVASSSLRLEQPVFF